MTETQPMNEMQWEYRVRALRMRPRFRMQVRMDADQVMARFRECFGCDGCEYVVAYFDHQVEVTVSEKDRHFWSPYLNLIVRPLDDGRAELDGRFGPNVNVWTMFMAAYAILGLSGSVGLLIGSSQWMLGHAPTGVYYALACLLGVCVVYGIAMVGQNIAGEQMREIRWFVESRFAGDGPCPPDELDR